MKATLTFTDTTPGNYKVNLEFDTPINKDTNTTPAVAAALNCIQFLNESNEIVSATITGEPAEG